MAVKSEQRRKLTRQEAGRLGGEKVARERGPEFFRRIGKKGGKRVAEQRGSDFYRKIGKKGGASRGARLQASRGRKKMNKKM